MGKMLGLLLVALMTAGCITNQESSKDAAAAVLDRALEWAERLRP